jgi:hypothetical protein
VPEGAQIHLDGQPRTWFGSDRLRPVFELPSVLRLNSRNPGFVSAIYRVARFRPSEIQFP